jgi:hypothetical protein
LVSSGAIEALPAGRPYYQADSYRLSNAAAGVLQHCLVGYRHSIRGDLRIGDASAFVVMPFSEPWSTEVFEKIIRPACEDAGLACRRGDTIPRQGDLISNVLEAICDAGIVLVDVSAPNVNVYYELGLCGAVGKDHRILKQVGTSLPADLAGAHYIEYSPANWGAGRERLKSELMAWVAANDLTPIKAEKAGA